MLQRAMQRSQQMSLFQKNMTMMSMRTVAGKNFVMPESVEDVIKTLDKQRPTFTLLYFSAAWNPMCAKIERDYENLTNTTGEFMHIKVDCDETPWVKKYFDARVEPQFLYLINGNEVERQIGYNFELIEKTAKRVVEAHSRDDFGYVGQSGKTWERFYDHFDRWSRYGEHDRDSLRSVYDYNSDQHRGPGTANP